MKIRRFLIIGILFCGVLSCAWSAAEEPTKPAAMALGIQAYQEERWTDAMGDFLEVLKKDPANSEAHAYLNLLVQQIESQRKTLVHEQRVAILNQASKRLEENRMDSSPIEEAIHESVADEKHDHEEHWHGECVMAAMEERMGHLEAANDIVLRILSENANDADAQRLLSDLQSRIREALASSGLSAHERLALQGFYAFGQADYRMAFEGWTNARAAIQKVYSGSEAARQVAALHFETYEKVARLHVEDEDRSARAQGFFRDGLAFYQKGTFDQALDNFRQVALIDAEFPQLGSYLAQSEAAVERDRTRKLSEEKRHLAEVAFAKGLSDFEQGNYESARQSFKQVLDSDPSDPKARTYLAQADAQTHRHSDPRAAEQHYAAGVIAYAAGHGDEAIREWHIALKLDPQNQKSTVALNKVQKVTELTEDLP